MEDAVKVAELEAEITDLKQQVQLLQEQLRLARQASSGPPARKTKPSTAGSS